MHIKMSAEMHVTDILKTWSGVFPLETLIFQPKKQAKAHCSVDIKKETLYVSLNVWTVCTVWGFQYGVNMYVFVHCKCVCLFQVLECLCVNNWWLSGVPAEIHYPPSSPVYYSVEDVFPSEADSFMIGDEGLGPPAKEKWPGRNSEPADPLARLCFYMAEMVTVPLLKVFLAVHSKEQL